MSLTISLISFPESSYALHMFRENRIKGREREKTIAKSAEIILIKLCSVFEWAEKTLLIWLVKVAARVH